MTEPDTSTSASGKNGVKTLGIRFKPALHTQLSVIAQLRGHSFQDEVIAACEAHVAQAKEDPALVSRIEVAIADIDRDAASRRDALAALFGTAEPGQAANAGAEQPAQPASGGKPSGQRRSGGSRATS